MEHATATAASQEKTARFRIAHLTARFTEFASMECAFATLAGLAQACCFDGNLFFLVVDLFNTQHI